jgi:hypothetical protein
MRFSFLRVWIITNGETTMPLRPHSEAGGWSQTYAYDNFGNRAVLTGVVNRYATPRATSQYTNNRWLSPKKRTPGSRFLGANAAPVESAGKSPETRVARF